MKNTWPNFWDLLMIAAGITLIAASPIIAQLFVMIINSPHPPQ